MLVDIIFTGNILLLPVKLDFGKDWQIQFGEDLCLEPYSIHWHWGSNDTVGSEHMMNGLSFPIEVIIFLGCESLLKILFSFL